MGWRLRDGVLGRSAGTIDRADLHQHGQLAGGLGAGSEVYGAQLRGDREIDSPGVQEINVAAIRVGCGAGGQGPIPAKCA